MKFGGAARLELEYSGKETGEWEMVFKEKKSSWKRTGDGVPIFSARKMRKNVR